MVEKKSAAKSGSRIDPIALTGSVAGGAARGNACSARLRHRRQRERPACRRTDSRRRPGTRSPSRTSIPAAASELARSPRSARDISAGRRADPGMRAAADALAMGVEQDRPRRPADVHSLTQQIGDLQAAAARSGSWRRAGRYSGRNRNSRIAGDSRPVALQIGAPVRAAQRLLQHAARPAPAHPRSRTAG